MNIDQQIYQHIQKHLNKKSIIIDIGAYNGKISKKLCEQTNGNPQNYYLIEACPQNYAILQKQMPQYNLHHYIINDKTGYDKLYTGKHPQSNGSSQANSIYKQFIKNKKWNKETTETTIQSSTLDDFTQTNNIQNIDFLKINCEGGEYKIFTTTTKFLTITQNIYLQMHGKDPCFLTKEIINQKIQINTLLQQNNYHIILGDNPNNIKNITGHTHQLWTKT